MCLEPSSVGRRMNYLWVECFLRENEENNFWNVDRGRGGKLKRAKSIFVENAARWLGESRLSGALRLNSWQRGRISLKSEECWGLWKAPDELLKALSGLIELDQHFETRTLQNFPQSNPIECCSLQNSSLPLNWFSPKPHLTWTKTFHFPSRQQETSSNHSKLVPQSFT